MQHACRHDMSTSQKPNKRPCDFFASGRFLSLPQPFDVSPPHRLTLSAFLLRASFPPFRAPLSSRTTTHPSQRNASNCSRVLDHTEARDAAPGSSSAPPRQQQQQQQPHSPAVSPRPTSEQGTRRHLTRTHCGACTHTTPGQCGPLRSSRTRTRCCSSCTPAHTQPLCCAGDSRIRYCSCTRSSGIDAVECSHTQPAATQPHSVRRAWLLAPERERERERERDTGTVGTGAQCPSADWHFVAFLPVVPSLSLAVPPSLVLAWQQSGHHRAHRCRQGE